MSHGIIPYMTSAAQLELMWASGIEVGKGSYRTEIRERLGFDMLPKQKATEYLKRFNKEIKKNHGVPDFSAHVVAKDFFKGQISYPTIPFVYYYFLEGLVSVVSGVHWRARAANFQTDFPGVPMVSGRESSKEIQDYLFERTLERKFFKTKGILPNNEWYPCDISIVNYLPDDLPMPLPEVEDFPFVSLIRNENLKRVFDGISFEKFGEDAKQQMKSWFDTCEKENRDLILFIY